MLHSIIVFPIFSVLASYVAVYAFETVAKSEKIARVINRKLLADYKRGYQTILALNVVEVLLIVAYLLRKADLLVLTAIAVYTTTLIVAAVLFSSILVATTAIRSIVEEEP